MEKLETKTSNASPEALEKNNKTNTLSETPSQAQSNSETPSLDPLAAIARLIALQNQAPPLQPISPEGNLPVSFAQERFRSSTS